MSLGPYVKINPNERPTEYLTRVQAAGSDGGTKITNKEVQEGHRLLQTWEWKKFKRLTTLPTQQLTREVRAIKEMQNLTGAPLNPLQSPIGFGGVGYGVSVIGYLGICSAVVLMGRIWIKAMRAEESEVQQNQSELINALETPIKELNAKKERGEITQADYDKELHKIIHKAVTGINPGEAHIRAGLK